MAGQDSTKFYWHPDYKSSRPKWIITQDLYLGDQDTLKSETYLPKFVTETTANGAKAFEQRQKRTFYSNLVQPIVEIIVSMLLKSEPNYSEIDKIITPEERENIDGWGTSFTDFVNDFLINSLLYGPSFAYVTAPKIQGTRPYLEIWNPLSVVDWIEEVEQDGAKLKEIHYLYQSLKPRTSGTDKPEMALYRKIIKQDKSRVTSELWIHQANSESAIGAALSQEVTSWIKVREDIEISLSTFPVVRGFSKSWIEPICPDVRKRHILYSSKENALHYQGYKHIIIAGSPVDSNQVPLSENAIFFVKEGSIVNELQDLNPIGLENAIAECTENIFKIALRLFRTVPQDSRQVQGASTLREEKDNQVNSIKKTIGELETILNQIVDVWADYKGTERGEGKIVFNREFSLADVNTLREQFLAYRDEILKYSEWKKAHLKKVVEQEDYPEDIVKLIHDQIDNDKIEKNSIQSDPNQDLANNFRLGLANATGTEESPNPR